MSEILSNIVLQPINSTFVAETNAINVNPEAIQLNIFTSGSPGAGQSSNGELLFNNNNNIDGLPNATVSGGNLSFTNLANLKIVGGSNHYYLQTDGTGNLTWSIGTGNMQGNGTVSGANTQIQFNDGGMSFGGNAGFTFDKTTGNVDIPGNLNVVGNIFGNLVPNYANFAGTAFNVAGGNVSGPVSNAAYADTAGLSVYVTANAQSNITSLGTLTSLTVAGMTSIQEAKEKVTLDGPPASTLDFNILTQAIVYNIGNATNDFIINFRGNNTTTLNSIMSNGESITCAYLNTNSTTGYYLSGIKIDGTTVTPKWVYPTGAPAVGISNGVDIYNFNIIKTNTSTYTVIASRIGYQ